MSRIWRLPIRFLRWISTFFYAEITCDSVSFVQDLKHYCLTNGVSLSHLNECREYQFYSLPDESLCVEQRDIGFHIAIRLDYKGGKVYLVTEKLSPLIHKEKQKMGNLIVRGVDIFAKVLVCAKLYSYYMLFFRPYCLFYKAAWCSLGFYVDPLIFRSSIALPKEEHIRAAANEIQPLMQFSYS